MRKLSIKLSVTLWYTLAMVLVSSVVLFATVSVGRNMIERDVTNRITRTVSDFSHRVNFPGQETPRLPDFMYYENGVHMALYDKDFKLIGGSLPFAFVDTSGFEDNTLQKRTYEGEKYYVFDREIHRRNQDSFWVRGVISLSDETYTLSSILKTNLLLTIALILAAAVGGYLILKRALRPVDRMSCTAKEISESKDLSRRIGLQSGNDEFTRLATTFDAMLDRIQQILAREKQFTSDASHELRTPVAVITSECEYMLECAKTPEEFRESVTAVKRQTDKMSKLISELLTLSRMDNHTQQITMEDVDISELLSFVCDEQEDIHPGSIRMLREIAPGITAKADRFLLARLFINLIANAYQYGKENGELRVVLTEDANTVTFSVADNGIGISAKDLPRIWERFYQADTARSGSENNSMGLGLSMVQWIAECHKGTVTAESKPGTGSTFTFTMPK